MHKASAGETVHPESHLLAELQQDFWGACRAEFTRTVKEGRVGGREWRREGEGRGRERGEGGRGEREGGRV